jgi:diguanylate cyclase (GGDEF)-like protein
VIDDDESSVRLVSRFVTNAGFECGVALDGEEALRQLLAGSFQIVIADWDMPHFSGLELCRAIRELEALPFMYLMLITAHEPTEERITTAFDAGVDEFVSKPLRRNDILARLHAACRMIALQQEVNRKQREIYRFSAQMQVANNKLAKAERQLRILASTDELTQLGNRRAAMDQLNALWSGSCRSRSELSCIMVDIDYFKKFNDNYGHDVGDQVLQVTAETLRLAARESDFVFRLGGEEFLILCPHSDEEAASVAAERFRADVANLVVRANGKDLRVTISAGVAQRGDTMPRSDAMMKAADDALYAAKSAGRNCVRRASCIESAVAAS